MEKLDEKYTGLLAAIYDVIAKNDAEAIERLQLDDLYIDYNNGCIVFIKDGAIYEATLQKSYAPAPRKTEAA